MNSSAERPPASIKGVPGAIARRVTTSAALSQTQQASGLIDLSTCEHHSRDRAAAQLARMQRGRGGELRAEVGGGVDQGPVCAFRRHGETRLRARNNTRVAVPSETTNRTAAIPLGIAAAGRTTEHDGGKAAHQPLRRGAAPIPESLTSEFCRQIAVDLEADA